MSDKPFLDTCVFVYALSDGDERQERAIEVIGRGGKISIQILNELANVCRKKIGMSWEEVGGALLAARHFCPGPVPLTLAIHEEAVRLGRRYGFSVYDCVMISAAIEAGCKTLYTEDLQHGQEIEGLRIENPFRAL